MEKKFKVVVLSGGISPERDVSIVSGKHVLEAMRKSFDAVGIRLDENRLPEGLVQDAVVFPAMHGDYGEDGTLQAELEAANIHYAGSGSLSSRVCMVKPAAKALMKFYGLPVARSLEFSAENKPAAHTLAELFPDGAIIKPADKGSSVGLIIAHNADEIAEGLEKISEGDWMAEEFVRGREFSVGVIYGEASGIVEIIPEGGVYDFQRKYTAGTTRYEFPAKLSKQTEAKIKDAAQRAFEACGCRDFARVDFILADDEKSDFIILEINTLPGMTPTSLLPKSASCVGYDYESLCAKLMEGAAKRRNAQKD